MPLARLVVSQGELDVSDCSLVLSNKAEEPTPNPPFDQIRIFSPARLSFNVLQEMKSRSKIIIGLLLAVTIGVVVYYIYEGRATDYAKGKERFDEHLASSTDAVAFEGLPHPGWEQELWVRELKKPHFNSRGDEFYSDEIKVADPDLDFLESIFRENLLDPSPKGISKACGGFHSDFFVAWSDADGEKCEAYFCFTCSEAKLFSGMYRIKADIPDDLLKKLRAMWASYRSERPELKTENKAEEPTPNPPSD